MNSAHAVSSTSGAIGLCPFWAACWLAIVAGWLEAGQHWLFRYNPDILTTFKVSADIFWINPLVNLLLLVPIALAGIAIAKMIRRPIVNELAVLACTWLGVYGLGTLTGKIHKAGMAVLALGVGVMMFRLLRRASFANFVRRTAPIFVAVVFLTAVSVIAATSLLERSRAGKLPAAVPGAPSVLLVVMDTVRADHLSTDGYPRETSPNIARWAAGATVFDNAFSTSSWTLPAHASMLTGRPAYEHGADRSARLGDEYLLLSEFLRHRGYATGAFTGNDIWLSGAYGFDRGFLRFRVMTVWSDAARSIWGRKIYSQLLNRMGLHHLPVRKSAAMVNAEFTGWLDDYPGRPFFALLNYFDVHDPYWPPPPFDAKFRGQPVPNSTPEREAHKNSINSYDGLVAYLDQQFGALMAELERRGLARNTVVILTADHGESLGDHKLTQHGDALYRELVRVPFIVAGPGFPAGKRVGAAISVQQIPATVASLLCSGPASAQTDAYKACGDSFPGASVTTHFAGDAAEEPVLAELKRIGGAPHAKSLITAEWQYIWYAAGNEELFNIKEDPAELRNLVAAPEANEVLAQFRSRLRSIFPSLANPAR